MVYWEKNLELLERKTPKLVEMLSQAIIPADHQVLASKKGPPPPYRWDANAYTPAMIRRRKAGSGPGPRISGTRNRW